MARFLECMCGAHRQQRRWEVPSGTLIMFNSVLFLWSGGGMGWRRGWATALALECMCGAQRQQRRCYHHAFRHVAGVVLGGGSAG